MKSNLNIKRMAKTMSFEDKAKLLFQDHDIKVSSQGKKRLLAPEEEDAIIQSCRDQNQINDLNRVTEIYNLNNLAIADVQMRTVLLENAISEIDKLFLTLYFNGILDELVSSVDFALRKDKKHKVFLKTILKDHKKRSRGFSWFHPPEQIEEEDLTNEELEKTFQNREPNLGLQRKFVNAINAGKKLKMALKTVETLGEMEEIFFVSEPDESILNRANQKLREFEELEGFTIILNVYRDCYEQGLIKTDNYFVPEFKEALINFKKALELTKEDEEHLTERINRCLSRN